MGRRGTRVAGEEEGGRRQGCSYMRTGSKAISATPAIGTAGREDRLRPARSKPNVKPSSPRCSGVEEHECDKCKTGQRRDRRLGNGNRAGSPCPGDLELKAVFVRLHGIRWRRQPPCP